MNDFRYKFSQFMQGRYGMDPLYYALLLLYLILLVLNMLFRKLMIFGILAWAVLIFAFYRFFSRDIYKRSRENEKFMELLTKVTNKVGSNWNGGSFGNFGGLGGRFGGGNYRNVVNSPHVNGPSFMTKLREFPEKKYATCPNCQATLRLPRQRGKHTVRCPRCGNRFGIHIIIGKKS